MGPRAFGRVTCYVELAVIVQNGGGRGAMMRVVCDSDGLCLVMFCA